MQGGVLRSLVYKSTEKSIWRENKNKHTDPAEAQRRPGSDKSNKSSPRSCLIPAHFPFSAHQSFNNEPALFFLSHIIVGIWNVTHRLMG
jgi:hypothetical protein